VDSSQVLGPQALSPRDVYFLVPGDLATRTGGYLYDRRVVDGLRARGWPVTVRPLGGGFPSPSPAEVAHARETLGRLPAGSTVVIDGLALGAMPEVVTPEASRLRLVGLIHHPLAEETGLDPATARGLHERERAALAATVRCVTTSRHTARDLTGYGVSPGRIGVVPPGTDPAPLAGRHRGRTLELLCVATLTPRKGHRVLLRALAPLRQHRWRLTCVGSLERHPATARSVTAQCRRLGLAGRVTFRGELDDEALAACYRRADLFVLASFHEGYGMALAEALARGLPVVSTWAGAIPETVPGAAGVLVSPGDVGALSRALDRVLSDPVLRERLAAGARRARRALPTWGTSAQRFAAELLLVDEAG